MAPYSKLRRSLRIALISVYKRNDLNGLAIQRECYNGIRKSPRRVTASPLPPLITMPVDETGRTVYFGMHSRKNKVFKRRRLFGVAVGGSLGVKQSLAKKIVKFCKNVLRSVCTATFGYFTRFQSRVLQLCTS